MTLDPIQIRRLSADDWEHKRTLRIAALADSPESFLGSPEVAAARDERDWRDWVGDGLVLGAFDVEKPVGLACGHHPEHLAGHAEVISMWVAPSHRGRGIAARLLTRIIEWARSGDADGVYLEYVAGNTAAQAAYTRAGFRPTGEPAAIANGVTMRLPLREV